MTSTINSSLPNTTMTTILKRILCGSIIFSGLWLWQNAWATCSWSGNTGTAAQATVEEITDCLTGVNGATDKTGEVVILLPAESRTWTTNLLIDMSVGFAAVTSLSIIGAGTPPDTCANATAGGFSRPSSCGSAASGGTIITYNGASMHVVAAPDKKFRYSNVSITGTAAANSPYVLISGSSKLPNGGVRLDHITIRDSISSPAPQFVICRVFSHVAVLVDHIDAVVRSQFSNWSGILSHLDNGFSDGGNTLWTRDLISADMPYIEDSYVQNIRKMCNASPWNLCNTDNDCADGATCGKISTMVADLTDGAYVTIRHNAIYDFYIGGHDFSSNDRGLRGYTINDNEFYSSFSYGSGFFGSRGGTGRAYNNTARTLREYPFATYSGAPCNGKSCGITFTNYRSDIALIDGLSDGSGWQFVQATHCETNSDRKMCIGPSWGTNAGAFCTGDSDCGGSADSCQLIDGTNDGYPCRDQTGRGKNQASDPWLLWNNRISFAGGAEHNMVPGVRPAVNVPNHIRADRDYCYTETVMPANCNGVVTTYTAYPYPHPLQDTADTTPPTAPTVLTVN